MLLLQTSSRMAVWWATSVEATSAIERKFRLREGTVQDRLTASLKLQQLAEFWIEVEPAESIRRRAATRLEGRLPQLRPHLVYRRINRLVGRGGLHVAFD